MGVRHLVSIGHAPDRAKSEHQVREDDSSVLFIIKPRLGEEEVHGIRRRALRNRLRLPRRGHLAEMGLGRPELATHHSRPLVIPSVIRVEEGRGVAAVVPIADGERGAEPHVGA